MENVILLMHPAFGGLATLAAMWVFVDTLNVKEATQSRIKKVSIITTLYVSNYNPAESISDGKLPDFLM